jgi:ketosteroid isomerase-like protein
VERSNLESVQRIFGSSQGVDVAPFFRAVVTGDTKAVPPQAVAEFDAFLDLFDPTAEIDTYGMGMLDVPRVLRGRRGVLALWGKWIEEWEHYSWIVSNLAEVGVHVIFDVEAHATGRHSGAQVTWKLCQVWTFRDGRVIQWRHFQDRATALAAIETP